MDETTIASGGSFGSILTSGHVLGWLERAEEEAMVEMTGVEPCPLFSDLSVLDCPSERVGGWTIAWS